MATDALASAIKSNNNISIGAKQSNVFQANIAHYNVLISYCMHFVHAEESFYHWYYPTSSQLAE